MTLRNSIHFYFSALKQFVHLLENYILTGSEI